jgi:hypothetical protein
MLNRAVFMVVMPLTAGGNITGTTSTDGGDGSDGDGDGDDNGRDGDIDEDGSTSHPSVILTYLVGIIKSRFMELLYSFVINS